MKKSLEEIRSEAVDKGVEFKNSDTIANIKKKIDTKEKKDSLKQGIVSKEQLQAWKKKHGKVHEITVKVTENDIAVGYLRKPTRDHKAIALSSFAQNKILETGEFLLQNCWLGGDDRLRDAEDIADSAAVQANSIVNFLTGSSKEI